MKNQSGRLDYLDWMRGLAALIMLQGHAFDSWLSTRDRDGEAFWLSQFLGGFPAPIFLFLVGVSLALVLDRMRQNETSMSSMLLAVMKRGGWILLLAYGFRIEQFLIWYPASRWTDVFRIDTLNCIAASTIVLGTLSIAFKTRKQNILALGAITTALVVCMPFLYSMQPHVPAFLLDYINGNGHPYYFSIFPWIGFALVGIVFGYGVLESRSRGKEQEFFSWVIAAGLLAYGVGELMRFFPVFEYGFFEYSLTSPHYFLVRIGWLSIVIYGAYRWSAKGTARKWSPIRTLGQASLLVYWVHMELVYGRPLHYLEKALDVRTVLLQLTWLIAAMLLLASVRQYGFGRLTRDLTAWASAAFSRAVPDIGARSEQ